MWPFFSAFFLLHLMHRLPGFLINHEGFMILTITSLTWKDNSISTFINGLWKWRTISLEVNFSVRKHGLLQPFIVPYYFNHLSRSLPPWLLLAWTFASSPPLSLVLGKDLSHTLDLASPMPLRLVLNPVCCFFLTQTCYWLNPYEWLAPLNSLHICYSTLL